MGTSVEVLDQVTGEMFCLINADCVEAVQGLASESVGFSLFSPPFSSLYAYSNSDRDMGNCATYEEFSTHFRFLIAELFRVLKPGRLCSVHCMNLPVLKSVAGYVGINDFRGDIVREFVDDDAADFHRAMMRIEARMMQAQAEQDVARFALLDGVLDRMRDELRQHPGSRGFIFHSEVCIWKDPVVAMQRTKSIRLLHKQMVKDSCMSGQAIPDYVVTFRKPGNNPEPVAGELDWFAGDETTFRRSLGGRLSIDIWQRYASPVWTDINQTRTLQYMTAKDEKDQRHIAPLQLDVIERCMQLWSNPGDVVLSPFAGIGSEIYVAVKLGRMGIGIELKGSYFKVGVKNARIAEQEVKASRLF